MTDIKWLPGSDNLFLAAHADGSMVVYDKEKEDAAFVPEETAPEAPSTEERKVSLVVKKSVNSRNQKSNPLAYWKAANSKINGFSFSPDCRHIAVVAEDGSVRIIDYLKETYVLLQASIALF